VNAHVTLELARALEHQPAVAAAVGSSVAVHLFNIATVVTHSQETCTKFLASNFRASSADDTSNKNGRSWTKQMTFSVISVDNSIGTQNFYLNNL